MKIFNQNTKKPANRSGFNQMHNAEPFFPIQKKIAVGKADDIYEKEADAVADKVVQHTEASPQSSVNTFFPTTQLQHKTNVESTKPVIQTSGLEDGKLQKKCENCENEEYIQQKTSGNQQSVHPEFEAILLNNNGSGSPLNENSKREMEEGFGADFSNVRIHTDSTSTQLNENLGAQAFTNGNNIYFNAGKYSPASKEGKLLLAHELTHTLQQKSTTPLKKNSSLQKKSDIIQLQIEEGASASAEACTGFEDQIRIAKDTAAQWVSATRQWFSNYERLIRSRAPRTGRPSRIGAEIFRNFQLLDDNFRISRNLRIETPTSAFTEYTSEQFVALFNASSAVRNNFLNMDVGSQTAMCFNNTCPTGRIGTEVFGSAFAGSGEYTLNTQCWSPLAAHLQAGVVLHECFHSSFSSFNNDTYSFESSYPGSSALTNAESYAIFASIIGSNSSYRSIVLDELHISAAAPSEAEREIPEVETTPVE